MKGLMLHCGGNEVDWNTIEMTPTPDATDSWTPIPHAELITGIRDTITNSGIQVINEHHGLAGDGARYFGLMQLVNGSNSDDYGTMLGIRNSHDKSFSAGLTVGAGVFVCDNLSFSGDIVIGRKHTTHIRKDLPRLIQTAVAKIGDARRTQDERFDAYKNHRLSHRSAHDLMIQALDVGAIGTRILPKIVQHWREPDHEEFQQCGKSLWRFFNACTEAYKVYNVDTLPRRAMALHGLLDSKCGLAVMA